MCSWTLWQFKSAVNSFLDTCSEEMQEILMRRLGLLSEKGTECKRPVSAPLGDGLFELRGKANRKEARLIYYYSPNRTITFVHAGYKSGSKISPQDMAKAKKNRKLIEERHEKAHILNLAH